ncbi:hypothetical protein NE237_015380 [Protea cynaroides]|uniref:Uncharacterized protein n=1 Tax=Protea cynaroides TaxID=273540 RepID=A0A9Q0KE36_9MAGN|nr:hypothetical protein NE237_015380 [Protea cynaroides]
MPTERGDDLKARWTVLGLTRHNCDIQAAQVYFCHFHRNSALNRDTFLGKWKWDFPGKWKNYFRRNPTAHSKEKEEQYMGTSCSSSTSVSLSFHNCVCYSPTTLLPCCTKPRSFLFFNRTCKTPFRGYLQKSHETMKSESSLYSSLSSNSFVNLNSEKVEEEKTPDESSTPFIVSDLREINPQLFQQLVYDALVWSSLHGLVVGDKSIQRSGIVPGVGLVQAPFALLPTFFPQFHWQQACELAPLFNELVDRVSLDGKFLQESLSRKFVWVYIVQIICLTLRLNSFSK